MRKWNALLILVLALCFASTVYMARPALTTRVEGRLRIYLQRVQRESGNFVYFWGCGKIHGGRSGNLTNGELDTNGVGGRRPVSRSPEPIRSGRQSWRDEFQSFGQLGEAGLRDDGNGNAKFIKFDASGGSGTIGFGNMEKADTSAYSTARIAVTMPWGCRF